MAGYTPLFGSIVTSSIWNEDSETRIVWITMLALSDANGKVEGSVSGIAPVARVSVESCEKALDKLKRPDKYSRTKEYGGRRIEDIEGGWQILNFTKFREKAKSRAEYYRHWRANRDLLPEQESNERNKSRIRIMISRAVRNGNLDNPKTLFCGRCQKQAEMYHHHNGYDEEHELDVVPVCKKCHKQIHLSFTQTNTDTQTQTQTHTQTAKQCATLQNSTQTVAKRRKFIPPTLIEVQKYIHDNNYDVNAIEFIKYYAASEPPWHDQNGKPVRSWKQKLIAVWVKKPKAKKCVRCGKMGVYVSADDAGQKYWLCDDHKPVHKPLENIPLPELKTVSDDKVDFGVERTRQQASVFGIDK